MKTVVFHTAAREELSRHSLIHYNPIMTAIVERIKKQINSLAPDEAKELFRELQRDFPQDAPLGEEDDDASVEAAWDTEIDARVKEVEECKVELVSGAEFRRSTDALFDELGLKRPK